MNVRLLQQSQTIRKSKEKEESGEMHSKINHEFISVFLQTTRAMDDNSQ